MKDENRIDIWDSHAHILPPYRTGGLVRWIKRAISGHPSCEDWTPEQVLAGLEECGVKRVFNLVFPLEEEETERLNLFNRDFATENPQVVPFGSLHIETPHKEEVVDRCILEYGFAGMKLHPYVQGFEAFSESFEPLFRKLDELGRPLLVHTGFDVFYQAMQDLEYLEDVLVRFPNMPLVLVHSLFPRFELAFRLLEVYPQVYLDMTNVVSIMRYFSENPREASDDTGPNQLRAGEILESFIKLLNEFSHRIMFGTDHPAGIGSPRQIYEDFDSFDFAYEIERDILGATASRFYQEHCTN